MIFWLDAQLPPQLALWLAQHFQADAHPIRDLGLRDATDRTIFTAARSDSVVLVSQDIDFVDLVQQQGPPPQLLWVSCGNSDTAKRGEIRAARVCLDTCMGRCEPVIVLEWHDLVMASLCPPAGTHGDVG